MRGWLIVVFAIAVGMSCAKTPIRVSKKEARALQALELVSLAKGRERFNLIDLCVKSAATGEEVLIPAGRYQVVATETASLVVEGDEGVVSLVRFEMDGKEVPVEETFSKSGHFEEVFAQNSMGSPRTVRMVLARRFIRDGQPQEKIKEFVCSLVGRSIKMNLVPTSSSPKGPTDKGYLRGRYQLVVDNVGECTDVQWSDNVSDLHPLWRRYAPEGRNEADVKGTSEDRTKYQIWVTCTGTDEPKSIAMFDWTVNPCNYDGKCDKGEGEVVGECPDCKRGTCISDRDCPIGRECVDGVCKRISSEECRSERDCPRDKECRDGICVKKEIVPPPPSVVSICRPGCLSAAGRSCRWEERPPRLVCGSRVECKIEVGGKILVFRPGQGIQGQPNVMYTVEQCD